MSDGAGGAAAATAALSSARPRLLALPWPSGGLAQRPAAALGGPPDPAPRPAPRAYRSRRLAAGVGLAAAGAAVAWWSEGRADRAYRRYLHAAAWRRQQRALDDAERYDRVAGGAYLAMHTGMLVCACVLAF